MELELVYKIDKSNHAELRLVPRVRDINQTEAEKNYYILNYLKKQGTWVNASEVKRGYGGSDLDRSKARSSLEDMTLRGYVEKRIPTDSPAKFEYKITEKGRNHLDNVDNMDPDEKHILGIRIKSDNDSE